MQQPTRLFRTAFAEGGYMAGNAFGFGWPISYATSPVISTGPSPYAGQGYSTNPFGFQQPYWQSPANAPVGVNPFSSQALQQIVQLLQIVPQQLQHVQQLEYQQHQLLQHVQQLLQVIPAQLAQLQQLIQFVPQQIQQLQQPSQLQQPFGQIAGLSGFASQPQAAMSPHVFGAQPGHVM
jgi:hypothetical protein